MGFSRQEYWSEVPLPSPNCFDFLKSLGLRMGLQPGAPFPILPFLQASFNLISCSKVVPGNGSLVQSLKENLFFFLSASFKRYFKNQKS